MIITCLTSPPTGASSNNEVFLVEINTSCAHKLVVNREAQHK